MKARFAILTLVATLTSALCPAVAQELLYDVTFESHFNNREYSAIEGMNYLSGTDFAGRLVPKVGVEFEGSNRLYFGVDMLEPFGGDGSGLFESVTPLLYYAYDISRWSVAMGIFERSRMMMSSYSTAFFADDYLLYDTSIGGVMARYMSGESFVEFVCDWQGQPSTTQREKFVLLSSGRRQWSKFYLGYALSATHFAGQEQSVWLNNVVDNILVNPSAGVRWGCGDWNFDLKLSYLQSLQRDRSYEDIWLSPSMGELAVKIARAGLYLDERLYIGKNLMPLYGGHIAEDGTEVEYGSQLYSGDALFTTDGGFYNRAAFGYERNFYGDKLQLRLSFVTHATSGGFGTEQQLSLRVNFGDTLYKNRRTK